MPDLGHFMPWALFGPKANRGAPSDTASNHATLRPVRYQPTLGWPPHSLRWPWEAVGSPKSPQPQNPHIPFGIHHGNGNRWPPGHVLPLMCPLRTTSRGPHPAEPPLMAGGGRFGEQKKMAFTPCNLSHQEQKNFNKKLQH